MIQAVLTINFPDSTDALTPKEVIKAIEEQGLREEDVKLIVTTSGEAELDKKERHFAVEYPHDEMEPEDNREKLEYLMAKKSIRYHVEALSMQGSVDRSKGRWEK